MKGDILVIGRFIMIKRKELGIERKDLAKNLDISYNYLNLIETEKRKVSKKLIPKRRYSYIIQLVDMTIKAKRLLSKVKLKELIKI